jgi:WD40 repeat protein
VAVSGGEDLATHGHFARPVAFPLRVWDVATGACVRVLRGHSAGVSSVCVTPDPRHLVVSGSADSTLRVWDLASGACIRTLSGHAAPVLSVDVTRDGHRVVSSSADHTLRIWDLVTGECLRVLEGFAGRVGVGPSGRWAVSASREGRLAILDLETGESRALARLDAACTGAAAISDTRIVASTTKEILFFDLYRLPTHSTLNPVV